MSYRRWIPVFVFVMLALVSLACGFGSNPNQQRAADNAQIVKGAQLGNLVMAKGIGAKNAPVGQTNTFNRSEDVIYAVVQANSIQQGTTMYARWYREGQPFEDTNQITADRDYQDTYVEFHIQPKTTNALQAGNYSVQIFVNGNPVKQANFTVR